jgi:hypothetical protein
MENPVDTNANVFIEGIVSETSYKMQLLANGLTRQQFVDSYELALYSLDKYVKLSVQLAEQTKQQD